MEENFKIFYIYPLKDFSGYEKEERLITIRTSPINKRIRDIIFELTIPKYIYDAVKNTHEKYSSDRIRHKIKGPTLGSIIGTLDTMCEHAISIKDSEIKKKDKIICILFRQNMSIPVSQLNHADEGKLIQSSFQFFVAFKYYKKNVFADEMMPEYVSDKQYESKQNFIHEHRKFYHHHMDGRHSDIEDKFDIIPWTQEREDFLHKVQNRMNEINVELDKFLGDLSETKIEALMANQPKILKA